MTLHGTENATSFETERACWDWINSRIVRFKIKMARKRLPEGGSTFVPEKYNGDIIDTAIDGFVKNEDDEPLKLYAAPSKQGSKWLAVMKVE
jgi:hypothetical protein